MSPLKRISLFRSKLQPAPSDLIRDVWDFNLAEEFRAISLVVQKYPYIAMDTEFPGIVMWPEDKDDYIPDYNYQLMRSNVDVLKIIQLGLTFFNAEGDLPEGVCTWQFNFKFDLKREMYAEDSVELLQNSGIQFDRHKEEGIDADEFADLMIGSGLVLEEKVYWIAFHSSYDFGYLLRLLTPVNLPDSEVDFFEMLNLYFPNMYDLKCLAERCQYFKIGLQYLADTLGVVRVGLQHQAGSDSLLTGKVFFDMTEKYFKGGLDDCKCRGQIFGFGRNVFEYSTSKEAKTI